MRRVRVRRTGHPEYQDIPLGRAVRILSRDDERRAQAVRQALLAGEPQYCGAIVFYRPFTWRIAK